MKTLSACYPVNRLADILEISRSGHYRVVGEGVRAQEEVQLTHEITSVFHEHKERYGSPRIYQDLKSKGVRCGKNRVAKLMRKSRLRAVGPRRKNPKTTNSSHNGPIAPNVLKTMDITGPNQAWAMDITYIECGGSHVFLAAVLDLYLHKIAGWDLADHLRSELACNALRKAYHAQGQPRGVLVHSDRGCQYASQSFIQLCDDLKCSRSMSAKGYCYDNAAMESFFGVLKREEMDRWIFSTIDDVRRQVFEYIETYYNRKRIHSTLGMTPVEFESSQKTKTPSAEFGKESVAPKVRHEKAGERTPQPRPMVATSGYPLERCSPAELSAVSPDNLEMDQTSIECNNKKEYRIIH